MAARGIVRGQRVRPTKVERARALRGRMTEGESLLWEKLRHNQLHGLHFRRQQVIDGFIVDFYCHARALVVEVDGDVHSQTSEYDAGRDSILATRGLRVLRLADADVRADVLGAIARIDAFAGR